MLRNKGKRQSAKQKSRKNKEKEEIIRTKNWAKGEKTTNIERANVKTNKQNSKKKRIYVYDDDDDFTKRILHSSFAYIATDSLKRQAEKTNKRKKQPAEHKNQENKETEEITRMKKKKEKTNKGKKQPAEQKKKIVLL